MKKYRLNVLNTTWNLNSEPKDQQMGVTHPIYKKEGIESAENNPIILVELKLFNMP